MTSVGCTSALTCNIHTSQRLPIITCLWDGGDQPGTKYSRAGTVHMLVQELTAVTPASLLTAITSDPIDLTAPSTCSCRTLPSLLGSPPISYSSRPGKSFGRLRTLCQVVRLRDSSKVPRKLKRHPSFHLKAKASHSRKPHIRPRPEQPRQSPLPHRRTVRTAARGTDSKRALPA